MLLHLLPVQQQLDGRSLHLPGCRTFVRILPGISSSHADKDKARSSAAEKAQQPLGIAQTHQRGFGWRKARGRRSYKQTEKKEKEECDLRSIQTGFLGISSSSLGNRRPAQKAAVDLKSCFYLLFLIFHCAFQMFSCKNVHLDVLVWWFMFDPYINITHGLPLNLSRLPVLSLFLEQKYLFFLVFNLLVHRFVSFFSPQNFRYFFNP